MRVVMISSFTWLLLATGLALGAEKTEWVCDSASDNAQHIQCADQEFRRFDAELNRLYQVLLQYAGEYNEPQAGYGVPPVPALQNAQRAWVVFRDANCHWKASGFYGGSGQAVIVADCRAQMTRDRVNEFKASLEP